MSLLCTHYSLFMILLTIRTLWSDVLTPTYRNSSGITITTTNEVITTVDNKWNITIQSQKTFQFVISLDPTRGFHPSVQSSIRITIHSPSIAANTQSFDDIVFGFATNTKQYFSLWIPMDNNGQKNRIYPYCDTSSVPTQAFAAGDISTLLNKDRNCDIAGGSCSNWNTMRPKNAQHPNVFEYNGFPITFTLENNPITDTLYVYFDTALFSASFVQKCGFVALPSAEGLTMYIGGNDIGQSFIISSFEIESVFNSSSFAIVDDSIEIPITTTVDPFAVPSTTDDDNSTIPIHTNRSQDMEQQRSGIDMSVIVGAIVGLFAVGIVGSFLYVKWCSGSGNNKVAIEAKGDMVARDALSDKYNYTEEGVTEDIAATDDHVRWHNLNCVVRSRQEDAIQDIDCEQEPLPPTYRYQ